MKLEEFDKHLDASFQLIRKNLTTNDRGYDWRISQLKALRQMLIENDEAFCKAIWSDLRKSKFEYVATEQGIVLSEIEDALKNLKRWMKPKRVPTPLYNLPGSSAIVREPLGLALVIGAWNYPVNLLLAPLVGAIAGGNAVILKPSEIANCVSNLVANLVPKYMDSNLIKVIEGGVQETSSLLDKQFDTIFFTGSGAVGKIVMSKAAKNLTPVTLELGGKSPCLVLDDADISVAAKRIAWGKFMNAGQTCVAPDYLLVHPDIKEKLVSEIKSCIVEAYGADAKKSPDFCRIINAKNLERLASLLEGEKIIYGGDCDSKDLFISPTLVEGRLNSPLMADEIFGPILPIIECQSVDKMIEVVRSMDKPLALYVFSRDQNKVAKVVGQTSSGGVCVNDVVMHMPVPSLPFGGVGSSGMGMYHGKFGFENFTHGKGVVKKATWIDFPFRYAPYTLRNLKILRWFF